MTCKEPALTTAPVDAAERHVGQRSAGLPRPYYYEDAAVTLYHGDAMELLPLMPTVDAIVTDPPYGETSLDWDTWPDGWPDVAALVAPQIWCFGSMRESQCQAIVTRLAQGDLLS